MRMLETLTWRCEMGNLVLGIFSIMIAIVLLAYRRASEWLQSLLVPVKHRPHARLAGR